MTCRASNPVRSGTLSGTTTPTGTDAAPGQKAASLEFDELAWRTPGRRLPTWYSCAQN